MFFLTPKYLKKGRLYLKEAKKRLAYNRDQWSPGIIADFDEVVLALEKGIKARDKAAIEAAQASLEGLCARHCPRGADAWIGEYVEVFLVAIIVALGIRTYLLQPFTIPTSSMYPTLCGVIGTKTEQEPPNAIVQAWQFAVYGRTWHNVVALADEMILNVEEEKRPGWRRFFTYTKITTSANIYYVNDLSAPITEAWGVPVQGDRQKRKTLFGMSFKKGEPIVRGYTSTGDHVFVDKVSYHFRTPTRGEVIVFTTANIDMPDIGLNGAPPRRPSQYYIKRLAGVPGDTLRIDAPNLYVNEKLAEESALRRVMSGTAHQPKDEYHGYSNPRSEDRFVFLTRPSEVFHVDKDQYFALGDNSYNSSDSRAWGSVPAENMMGTGFFVYWPFARDKGTHFGLIR